RQKPEPEQSVGILLRTKVGQDNSGILRPKRLLGKKRVAHTNADHPPKEDTEEAALNKGDAESLMRKSSGKTRRETYAQVQMRERCCQQREVLPQMWVSVYGLSHQILGVVLWNRNCVRLTHSNHQQHR